MAGNDTQGTSGDGGPAVNAQFESGIAMAADTMGNVFVTDGLTVRKVAVTGIVTTIAGNGTAGFSGDGGPATSAQISGVSGLMALGRTNSVVSDASGNIYFSTSMSAVFKLDSKGVLTRIAGSYPGYSGEGGPAVNAQLGWVSGVAVDNSGNVYLADQYFDGQSSSTRIRKVSSDGTIDAISASAALALQDVAGLATNSSGNLCVADYVGNRVVEILAGGAIVPIAGIGTPGFSGDGGPAISAQLHRSLG